MVITKPAENVDVQLILSLIANLKASEINKDGWWFKSAVVHGTFLKG